MKILKNLTDAEYKLTETIGDPFEQEQPIVIDGKFVYVHNIDGFKELLNDEIDKCFPTDDNGKITQAVEGINVNVNPKSKYYEGSESQKQDNLKSILNKLKEEEK